MKWDIALMVLVFFCSILIPDTLAQKNGHITLLAVSQSGEKITGNTADIYLEIIPGNSRVFLDTFPLTKLDTQMSTRFAKEIACDYYDINCEKFDFIYTIRAGSSIIGGPSAGSAVSILTAALLMDKELEPGVAITGTINSGGIIGNVAGVKQKIEAAKKNNLTKVIIPKGSRFQEEDNVSIDLIEYGNELGITVVEVALLDEAITYFTDIPRKIRNESVTVSRSYNITMKNVAFGLCNRSTTLSVISNSSTLHYESAMNLSKRGKRSFNSGVYYSAASYCFGSNVQFRSILYNDTKPDFAIEKIELLKEINDFYDEFSSRELKTISDLQTSIIVKERVTEALDVLEQINDSYNDLAYARERFFSAISWSQFFGTGNAELILDESALRNSCIIKLKEAEERYQYANLLFPDRMEGTRDEIDKALDEMQAGNYEICLFKASKAKAQSDIFIGLLGNNQDNIQDLIDTKLEVTQEIIRNQENSFPILGYSYFEYAKSLKDHDEYSALLYSEYALELSDLEMYFEKKTKDTIDLDFEKALLFVAGIVIGILIASVARRDKTLGRSHLRKTSRGKKR